MPRDRTLPFNRSRLALTTAFQRYVTTPLPRLGQKSRQRLIERLWLFQI